MSDDEVLDRDALKESLNYALSQPTGTVLRAIGEFLMALNPPIDQD